MSKSIEPKDGRDALDDMFKKMYPNNTLRIIPNKCNRPYQENNYSILNEIIEAKLKNKAIPLTLRKRMLYEHAIAS